MFQINLLIKLTMPDSIQRIKIESVKKHCQLESNFLERIGNQEFNVEVSLRKNEFILNEQSQTKMNKIDSKTPFGKIRKNSVSTIIGQNAQSGQASSSTVQRNLIRYRDEVLCRIRASQISDYNSRPLTEISCQENSVFQKKCNNKYLSLTGSLAKKYELKIDVVLGSFEARKKKIDEKITDLLNIKHPKNKFVNSQVLDHLGKNNQRKSQQIPIMVKENKKIGKVRKGPKYSYFLQALKKQIQLEERLRKAKHQINQNNKIKVLQAFSLKPESEIFSLISLEKEEFDPYIKPLQIKFEQLITELEASWSSCELHWSQQIKNRFDKSVLDLVFCDLSGEKKNLFVGLNEFVREMGILMQNQKYLRKRDLFRVYNRIQPFTKQNFLKQLSIKPDC